MLDNPKMKIKSYVKVVFAFSIDAARLENLTAWSSAGNLLMILFFFFL